MAMPPFKLPVPQLGPILRSHRLAAGLTVEELASRAGMAPSAIRAIEDNNAVAPTQQQAKALIAALALRGDDRDMFEFAATMGSPILRGFLHPNAQAEVRAQPLTASILVFLIADVRGYTRFTQGAGDTAAARLAVRFADVTRSVVERWDGRLVELRGDEALVVFGSARQALRAALDLQDEYGAATVDDPALPLPVGIGLDVGEAVALEEGFRGAALNRAARLCAMAGAGEVLATQGVRYIAPIVEGVAFGERPAAAVKGVDEPIAICGVTRQGGTTATALPVPRASEQE